MPNKVVFNINKVIYMHCSWVSQQGITKDHRPTQPTVYGETFELNAFAATLHQYPCETLYERARRLDILDTWTCVVLVVFSASRRLHYKGPKAEAIWGMWCEKQFSKSKKKDK